jgi:DNA-binding LacI/PurR family transcriptional regulator
LTTIARDLGVTARHVAESVLKRLDGRTTPSRHEFDPMTVVERESA